MRYPQFVRYAMTQLDRMPRLRKQLYKGIDIYTTLDSRLQDLAQRTVTRQINGLISQHVTDGALVSLDLRPRHYGWILAMVGSAHYSGQAGQINMAISPRQPGSSMKPFNYIWAFTHGDVGPATTVIDSPIRLPDPQDPQDQGVFQPLDYDRQFHGTVTLRQALANSLNVPAVKVEYYITKPVHVAQTAARFGMTSLYKDNPGLDCSVCYAVTLGGLAKGTRLLEETAAYSVFATGGVTVPPVAIWKVVQRGTGKVLYCTEACPRASHATTPKRRRVLDPAHAYLMTNILADNNARCTVQVCEFGLNSPLLLSRPAAAKTGTTNSFSDNWTVGYTPQIITGVWTGNADRSPMVSVIGITGAAPIWHDFMEGAFRTLRLPVQHFVQPPNVVQSATCTTPGTSYTQTGLSDLYVTGSPIPLCAIPDRGFMPAPCSAYQQNPTPLYPSQSTGPCEAYGPAGYSTTPQPYGAQYPSGTQYQQPTGQYQSGTQYQQPSTTYPSTGQPQ
jgi:membrane peptidoglycan carboxypeptidase